MHLKYIVVSLAFTLPASLYAFELVDYTQMTNAIHQGKQLTVVSDFSKCTPTTPVLASHSPESVMITRGKVLFSYVSFTLNNPAFPNEAINEYVKYELAEDGMINISTTFIDAKTNEVKSPEFLLECKFNQGINVYTK